MMKTCSVSIHTLKNSLDLEKPDNKLEVDTFVRNIFFSHTCSVQSFHLPIHPSLLAGTLHSSSLWYIHPEREPEK